MEKPINITLDRVESQSGTLMIPEKKVMCDFSVKMMLTEKQVSEIKGIRLSPKEFIKLINDRKAL